MIQFIPPSLSALALPPGAPTERLQSLLGLVCFLVIAFLLGRLRGHRKLPSTRTLFWGILLQFLFGFIVTKNRTFLVVINDTVDALLGFTRDGAKMVFGNLV